jgi:hypothetical protein
MPSSYIITSGSHEKFHRMALLSVNIATALDAAGVPEVAAARPKSIGTLTPN